MAQTSRSSPAIGGAVPTQCITDSSGDLLAIVRELLLANGVRQDVHIRPSLFVAGDGSISARGPVSFGVVIAPGNPALAGDERAASSMRLAVSSWRRIDDNTMSPRIKCAANYQNGRMALIQAEDDGYDGALMLDANGHVTEEPRACIFMVRDGVVITPAVTNDILESITRDTVIQLLREAHSIDVIQREVDRTELYIADELFLAGTACYCSAIKSSLTVKRKCPHEGACDIDAEGAGKTSGAQQLTGRAHDPGPGGNPHGSERTPHQAHPGGL